MRRDRTLSLVRGKPRRCRLRTVDNRCPWFRAFSSVARPEPLTLLLVITCLGERHAGVNGSGSTTTFFAPNHGQPVSVIRDTQQRCEPETMDFYLLSPHNTAEASLGKPASVVWGEPQVARPEQRTIIVRCSGHPTVLHLRIHRVVPPVTT